METSKELPQEKRLKIPGQIQNLGPKSRNLNAKTVNEEIPSIRLSPEQIEEIHADEYSLTLFYATRVEPLSLEEVKRQFPEPEPKKALSVLDRYLKAGLVHINTEGKYYSNFPENYINYSDYRYDSDLEAKKDGKVFSLMKEFTGNKDYWKNKTYFSMDAFYTKEQTAELQEMFYQIKIKSKEFANDNAKKKSVSGLFFRRLKFYDMMFSLIALIFLTLGSPNSALAGGNDPTLMARVAFYQDWLSHEYTLLSGGGNDPTLWTAIYSPDEHDQKRHQQSGNIHRVTGQDNDRWFDGGGGHDPTCTGIDNPLGGGGHDPSKSRSEIEPSSCCFVSPEMGLVRTSPRLCQAQALLRELVICEDKMRSDCSSIEEELIEILSAPQRDH